MSDQGSKKKQPRALNTLAFSITQEATSEVHRIEERIEALRKGLGDLEARLRKKLSAVELGRRGGVKGGVERARRLTAEQPREIAHKAAKARWQKKAEELEDYGGCQKFLLEKAAGRDAGPTKTCLGKCGH